MWDHPWQYLCKDTNGVWRWNVALTVDCIELQIFESLWKYFEDKGCRTWLRRLIAVLPLYQLLACVRDRTVYGRDVSRVKCICNRSCLPLLVNIIHECYTIDWASRLTKQDTELYVLTLQPTCIWPPSLRFFNNLRRRLYFHLCCSLSLLLC